MSKQLLDATRAPYGDGYGGTVEICPQKVRDATRAPYGDGYLR